jgi:serine/threonine protein kinase
MIDRDGEPKILDFGLAKLRSAESGASVTHPGIVMGTPGYMPVEQALGGDVDARAGVYALGVCLFEMLTGERPSSEAPKLRGVSQRVAQVVARCLEPAAANRFADAPAVLEALEQPERPAAGVPRWAIAAAVASGLVTAAIGVWLRMKRPAVATSDAA